MAERFGLGGGFDRCLPPAPSAPQTELTLCVVCFPWCLSWLKNALHVSAWAPSAYAAAGTCISGAMRMKPSLCAHDQMSPHRPTHIPCTGRTQRMDRKVRCCVGERWVLPHTAGHTHYSPVLHVCHKGRQVAREGRSVPYVGNWRWWRLGAQLGG